MSVEWGTGVGLEDQPSIDPGAESPSSESPAEHVDSTSTEVTQQPATETTQQPAEQPKPQEPPKDEFEEFGKTLTGRNADKWNKLLADRKQANEALTQHKATIGEFEKLGVTSPADVQHLSSRIQQLETEVGQYTTGSTEEVLNRIAQRDPSGWNRFAVVYSAALVSNAAKYWDQQIIDAKTPEERDEAIARAQFLREESARLGKAAPAAGVDPNAQRFSAQQRQVEQQQNELWKGQVHSAVQTAIDDKINPYIANVKFLNDKQRAEFHRLVKSDIENAFAQRTAFLQRTSSKLYPAVNLRSDQLKQDLAGEYAAEITRGGTLEKIIADRLELFGLAAQSRENNRQQVLNGATARTEATGGGSPVGTAKTKEQVFAEIDKEFPNRGDEWLEARQLWRMRI